MPEPERWSAHGHTTPLDTWDEPLNEGHRVTVVADDVEQVWEVVRIDEADGVAHLVRRA